MTSLAPRLLLLLLSPALGLLWGCTDETPTEAAPPTSKPRTPSSAPSAPEATVHTNRLADESSPYLRQHMHNPVDWYPWGEEAFEKARRENKPVFLSIGYSTCHWCHVMEHESFEDESIAAYLNEHFVSVKVDREERPDVDAVYMAAVQAMGRRGGWPLSVFMRADGKPFYVGTYFPPADRFGRPGFRTVLERLNDFWTDSRGEVDQAAERIAEHLATVSTTTSTAELGPATLSRALEHYRQAYDPQHGGFGPPPKFPRAFSFWFLMRQVERTRDSDDEQVRARGEQLLAMVEHTLQAIWRGGIRDHVGGGFHRYSTDERWLLPHFEKMLYDQALLVRAYVEAHQLTGDEQYETAARDALDYVLRDLRDPAGGFHSAEDADSEGEEGTFYVFTRAELTVVLGESDARFAAGLLGATEQGNFVDEASGHRSGGNILHLPRSLAAVAKQDGVAEEELRRRLASVRERLFEYRATRERPHLDDKVLTDWNGLFIATLARASAQFDEPRYLDAATEAADFLARTMVHPNGRLLHRYRDGQAGIDGFLEDYAYLAYGLSELYEVTHDVRWLRLARDLVRQIPERFASDAGGFHLTADDAPKLMTRTRELYDGALPSGNSVAIHALHRIGRLCGDETLLAASREALEAWSGTIDRFPNGYPFALLTLDAEVGPSREIVIVGTPGAADTELLLAQVRSRYLPRAVVHVIDPAAGGDELRALAPYLADKTQQDGVATAYVCTDFVCTAPVTTPDALASELDR